MEYDVWQCFVNGRTSYKAVPTKGSSLDEAKPPGNAVSHLERLFAPNARAAIHATVKENKRWARD